MATFKPFVLERMMGKWENVVEINLSESGVHPLKLGELMAMAGRTVDELADVELDYIVVAAQRSGAWILADEVYAGAERETDVQTPTFYGLYDKVIAVGSMSKAYGLPGLRTGWAVGPAKTLDDMWARHDYITITNTMLSDKLATLALSETVRPKILARTRGLIRAGYPVLQKWVAVHGDMFQIFPSQAAAVAFLRYELDINSTALVTRLRDEKSVFIVPGDQFGFDRHLRVSFGLPHDYLNEGLRRIDQLCAGIER